jgi:N-acetylglucosamine malate deacetylase 1
MIKKEEVLIIAPHPDDDVIGMGGTISKYLENETKVTIIYATNGSGSKRLGKFKKLKKKEFINLRKQEAIKAIKKLAKNKNINLVKQIFVDIDSKNLKLRTNDFKTTLKETLKNKFSKIYLPYLKDKHETHKVCSKISLNEIKKQKKEKKVLFYEVWTPITEEKIELKDITKHIRKKKNAIKTHRSQISVSRFDEGILAKNRYNAVFSTINSTKTIKYAEIFLKA